MTASQNKGWIGVDLDGTLAYYDGWKGEEHVGKPIPRMATRVNRWITAGKDVRIFTARVSGDDPAQVAKAKAAIEVWCLVNLGIILPITCKKDYAMTELWDDRAVQIIPNTGQRVDNLGAD